MGVHTHFDRAACRITVKLNINWKTSQIHLKLTHLRLPGEEDSARMFQAIPHRRCCISAPVFCAADKYRETRRHSVMRHENLNPAIRFDHGEMKPSNRT